MKKNDTLSKLLLTFACLLSSTLVFAQDNRLNRGGGGGFLVGDGLMDVSALRAFVPSTVGKFDIDQLLIGGTGHGIINRWVFGGTGFAMIGDKVTTDSITYSLGGGLGTLDFGYVLFNRNKLKMFPMIGIGAGGYGITVASNKNIKAQDIANNTFHENSAFVGNWVADASVNLMIIPILDYDEKSLSYGGLMAQLKIGYIYGLPKKNWKNAGADVLGGPKFGMNLLYVQLAFGGFGYRKF